jgi:predicted nucleotidyltransferase
LGRLLGANVVDSRRSGRNRIFSLRKNLAARQYIPAAEHYKCLKIMSKYPEVAVLMEELLKKTDSMVVLFGSHANLTAKKDSDIDVFVEGPSSLKKGLKIHSRLSVKIGEFDKSNLLIKEIIKNHAIFRGVEDFYEKTGFFEED